MLRNMKYRLWTPDIRMGTNRVKKLICYQISVDAPAIVPARPERAWMDATVNRFAYRCLPLTIANSMGWEILCPITLTAEWNGGAGLDDVTVHAEDQAVANYYAQSHFGHGVLTFQTHYLFRTEPAIALWVRGSPNFPKDGIAPLDGIVETDWLNFTFTMNWIFTRPGRVTFEQNEPFCFITPVAYHALDEVAPEIRRMTSNPKLAAEYAAYGKLRQDFNTKLAENDPEVRKQGWQKWYLRGEHHSGEKGNPRHVSKLSLKNPRQIDEPAEVPVAKASRRKSQKPTPQKPKKKKRD
jgi:hypothetical protein